MVVSNVDNNDVCNSNELLLLPWGQQPLESAQPQLRAQAQQELGLRYIHYFVEAPHSIQLNQIKPQALQPILFFSYFFSLSHSLRLK